MKHFFSLIIIITSLTSTAQTKVDSKITDATVYLKGAVVERHTSVDLNGSEQEFIFKNLTTSLDESSIQVKGSRDFTILSVNYRLNYLDGHEPSDEEKELRDSLEFYENEVTMLNFDKEMYTEERSMILMNQDITGSDVGIDIIQLEDMADYFRNRLTSIELKLVDIQEKETRLRHNIRRISNELSKYDQLKNQPTGEIAIKIKSNKTGRSALGISYLVRNAGWTTNYDIRAIDINTPVQLTYKGNVYQSTGIDWLDVNITLSTGNPSKSNTKPEFSTWWLNASSSQPEYRNRQSRDAYRTGDLRMLGTESTGISDNVSTNQGTVNTEFEINMPYSIISGAKARSIEIQKMNLPSSYEYYAAPRFDKDAFLMAHVTGWEAYSLMPGKANIYYDGTYVGESYLNPAVTEDTLKMSLGRDQGLSVDWEKVTDMSSKQIIGSKKTVKYGYVLKVKNNKNTTIVLTLEDHYPIAARSDIEVELLESSGAKIDEETGLLKWELIMGPDENKEIKFSFEVKYPKDKDISNL